MNSALGFHAAIDPADQWSGVPVDIVGGINKSTLMGVRQYQQWSWKEFRKVTVNEPVYNTLGDGVVSLYSVSLASAQTGQNLRGTATFTTFTSTHGGLVINADVLAYVDSLLGFTSTVRTGEAAGDGRMVQITAHGVDAIDATDASGHRTGVVDGDLVMEGIPGSAYHMDQETRVLALLADQPYTITVTPHGAGPFALFVSRVDSSEIITTSLYLGLPTTESRRLLLSGDPYTTDAWELISGRAGSSVQSILPSNIITRGSILESIAPTAVITLAGAIGEFGWYTGNVTVTLGAIDDGSGADHVEYSFGPSDAADLYTGPFMVDAAQVAQIHAVAVDRFGNMQHTPTFARVGPDRVFLPLVNRTE